MDIDLLLTEQFGDNLIVVCNASELSEEEYTLVRKDYFGASDSSVLCGVNLYKKIDELIVEKNTKFVTDAEKEIGKKPAVRMGRDLEPLVLEMFEKERGVKVFKPKYMYKLAEFPYLTINYDGIMEDLFIPVEAKTVTRYGEKYYNKLVNEDMARQFEMDRRGSGSEHIKYWADKCGIPAYYYTQVQQQLMGTNAEYGYLAALFVDSWTFKIFYIPRDEITISYIVSTGERASRNLVNGSNEENV